MDRREKLLLSILGKEPDLNKVKMLDTTVKIILGDMGKQYCKFWDTEGPGVMCFQPNQKRSMFFMTLKEMHSAQETCERENNRELSETFRRVIESAQKVNPQEKAAYLINDDTGLRYFEVCYNEASNSSLEDIAN